METNTVHQLIGKEKVSGSMRGYAFSGWDYDGGWLVGFSPLGGGPEKTVWADSKTVFYAFPNPSLAGQENIEISPEPIALTDEEKDAILGMAWQWEIWEPMSRDGMCMVQCLTKYLDLPEDDIVEMFRRAFRD